MPPNDSDRPDGDGRSAGPADTPTSPVGTVAEEAAKLVEMLAAAGGPWMGTGGPDPARAARGAAGATGASGSSDADGPSGHEPTGERRDRPAPGGPEAAGSHTCTCGGTSPQSCRLCPVCQVISFVSSISPETIERAADLVGFAAVALRDLATAHRERQGAQRPARSPEDLS